MSQSSTGSTLFRVLADPSDGRAWTRFVNRYAPRVQAWRLCWGLQDADAQEVTQEVLLKLLGGLRTYDRRKASRCSNTAR